MHVFLIYILVAKHSSQRGETNLKQPHHWSRWFLKRKQSLLHVTYGKAGAVRNRGASEEGTQDVLVAGQKHPLEPLCRPDLPCFESLIVCVALWSPSLSHIQGRLGA